MKTLNLIEKNVAPNNLIPLSLIGQEVLNTKKTVEGILDEFNQTEIELARELKANAVLGFFKEQFEQFINGTYEHKMAA